MNKTTITVSVRLLAIYCFIQSYSFTIPNLASQNYTKSWHVYLPVILFILIVPVMLWLFAPMIARLQLRGEQLQDDSKTVSASDLLAVGIFLLGLFLLPDGLLGVIGTINQMLTPRENFTSSELWQYSTAVRNSLIFGISKLCFALFFIFGSKKIVSWYKRYGNNG